MSEPATYTAFAGVRRLAAGDSRTVAAAVREAQASGESVLVFEDCTGRQVEVDPLSDVPQIAGAPAEAGDPTPRGRGRPKLGVVPREVTLLPRHWDWLSAQPGGASAALRRLVDEARRGSAQADEARRAQQAAYGAMSALAGDLPGFEEASRALFAGDQERLEGYLSDWPVDIGKYVRRLARSADA